jgi:hypothetical protein
MELETKIRTLLAAGRTQLTTTIRGNRIQARILEGGTRQTSKLIAFVHNPEPKPAMLFELAQALLTCIGSDKRRPKGDRWLIIRNPDGLAPVETIRQICLALRAQTAFKRILLGQAEGVRIL